MSKKINPIVIIFTTTVVAVVLAVVAALVITKAGSARNELPVLGKLADFELTERSGDTFSTNNMLGKISVVNFFFTSCQGPCPIMAGNMSVLYTAFAGNDKVQFLSISVDPVTDSLPVLREYAQRQGVNDNRWLFVRGEKEKILQISEKQFMLAADALPMMHSIKFVLVDEKRQIRGYYTGTESASISTLKIHIAKLLKKSA